MKSILDLMKLIFLLGDASKAKEELGWEPKTKFKELISLMVKADLKRLEVEK